MKLDHVTFSRSGGAGLVASRLQEIQAATGLDSRVFAMVDKDLFREPFKFPLLTLAAELDRHLVSNGSSKSLLSYFRTKYGEFGPPRLRDDSIIHLHWIEGVATHRQIVELLDMGRKIVWTVHDMSPFTAVCHHAQECQGYTRNCDSCPQVRKMFKGKTSIALSQKILNKEYKNLRIVAPTNWLSSRVRSSAALGNQAISVIPNPISPIFYDRHPVSSVRTRLGINPESLVGIAIASNLRDENKRIQELIEVFQEASARVGDRSLHLLLVGANGQGFMRKSRNSLVHWLGELKPNELARQAPAANFVTSYSLSESAGMTIRECAALGLPAIAFEGGALGEMFVDGTSGLLATSRAQFTQTIVDVGNGLVNLEKLGSAARVGSLVSHPQNVEKRYRQVYESLL
jgi:glycosyltransferase involved in cell wall biosynthesis